MFLNLITPNIKLLLSYYQDQFGEHCTLTIWSLPFYNWVFLSNEVSLNSLISAQWFQGRRSWTPFLLFMIPGTKVIRTNFITCFNCLLPIHENTIFLYINLVSCNLDKLISPKESFTSFIFMLFLDFAWFIATARPSSMIQNKQ